jgi:enoyl-CoA hydratase/carnithine racemase
MSGSIQFNRREHLAEVTISHPGKFNAMSRAMWIGLKDVFVEIQNDPNVRCVVISGEGGHFCAGGDISEYAGFRFDKITLQAFHEDEVWQGLEAVLACDTPVIARIDGNCMGAGVEIASCCDFRIASAPAKFGAPIAKLGFPMAPRELALVSRVAGDMTTREMLLSASVLGAADLLQRGFLNQVVDAPSLADVVQSLAQRICALAPQAARMNKQTLRALSQGIRAADQVTTAYNYANSAEHREGIAAFMEKRTPTFAH